MRPISFRMRDFRLPSGLRILVEEDHTSAVVGIVNVVGAGSANEPPGKEGMAHFVEHLAFRTRPTAEGLSTMWDLLERAGAALLNAYTTLDRTVYFEFGSKDAFPDLLRLESARMLNPLQRIDEHIVDVEREVVRNELRQRGESQSVSTIFGWVLGATFPEGHPYHHPPIGTHESLNAIKLADIQRFVKLNYRLDNMTMVIVGDVDLATVDKVLGQNVPYLVGDPKNPVAAPAHRLPAEPLDPPDPPPHEGLYTYESYVSSPELWIGFSLPGGFRPDSDFMDFVNQVLNAELGEAVREDRDIKAVASFIMDGTRASVLICQVKLLEGSHPEKSAQHVLNELSNLWLPAELRQQQRMEGGVGMMAGGVGSTGSGDKVSAILFNKMRLEAATGMALDSEVLRQRATAIAEFLHFTGEPAYYSRKLKAMVEMEEARIAGFANKYLRRERARVVYVKPLLASARVAAAGAGLGTTDEAATAAFDYDPAAISQLAHSPELAKVLHTVRLKNGLEVIIGRRAAAPMVTVYLALKGGSGDSEPLGAASLARYIAQPVSKRHGNFADYGVQVDCGIGLDRSGCQFRAGSGNLANVLAILSDRVQSMRVEQGAAGLFKKYVGPILKKEEDQAEWRADRAFWKALYGNHPFGRRASLADLERVDEGMVERWLGRVYNPRNATLTIIGDVDLADAEKLAREWLEDWKADGSAGEVPAPAPPAIGHVAVTFPDRTHLSSPPAERILVTHRPGATQGELRLGCLVPAADEKTAVMYEVMADMVGRHLFRSVRQQLGASYGINGSAQTLRGGASHIVIGGNITNEKLAPALKVIREYWDGLPAGQFAENEMNQARWNLARSYNMRFTTTSDVADEVVAARAIGWSVDVVDKYPQYLASLTKAELQKAFAACHETQVISIVGDERIIRDALNQSWK
jgi:zinc protease